MRRKTLHVLFLLLACCCIATTVTAAELRPKIAILPFDSSLDKKFTPLAESMPDLVTACFTTQDVPADIVDRSALAAVTAEQTAGFDAAHFSKIEGATHLLRGSLAPQDNGVLVTLMLYDLASTKLVASATTAGGTGEMPETACAGVKSLGVKIPALATEAVPEKGLNDRAAEQGRLMMEGLGAYYNGAFDKAFAPFLKLMRNDPANAAAAYWLAKSYQGAGMADEARIAFKIFVTKFPNDPRAAEVVAILKSTGTEQKHD